MLPSASAGAIPTWSTFVAIAIFGALCALDLLVPARTEATVTHRSPVALHQPEL